MLMAQHDGDAQIITVDLRTKIFLLDPLGSAGRATSASSAATKHASLHQTVCHLICWDLTQYTVSKYLLPVLRDRALGLSDSEIPRPAAICASILHMQLIRATPATRFHGPQDDSGLGLLAVERAGGGHGHCKVH